MTNEEAEAVAIETGRECGEVVGDVLAQTFASDLPTLTGPLRDAFIFEALGKAYVRLKASEAELLAAGASHGLASLWRVSAQQAVVHRVRLGEILATASGTPN